MAGVRLQGRLCFRGWEREEGENGITNTLLVVLQVQLAGVYYSCPCNNLQSMSVGDSEMEVLVPFSFLLGGWLGKRTWEKGASALFTFMSR